MSRMSSFTGFHESDFNFAFSEVQGILVVKIGKYVKMPFTMSNEYCLNGPDLDIQFAYFPSYRFLQTYLNIYFI